MVTVTGLSTCWTFDSSMIISLALRQSCWTCASDRGLQSLSWAICLRILLVSLYETMGNVLIKIAHRGHGEMFVYGVRDRFFGFYSWSENL